MRIVVEVLDAIRIECRRTADDPVFLITFFEEKFRKIRTILPSDTCIIAFFTRIIFDCDLFVFSYFRKYCYIFTK